MWIYFVCGIILIYVYLTWNYSYWKKRGIAGPVPQLIHGNTPSFLFWKRHITYDFHDIYNKFKEHSVVGIYILRSPALLLRDTKLVKQVLITKFNIFRNNEVSYQMDKHSDHIFGNNPFVLKDDGWKTKRSQISPAMAPARIKALSPLIEDVSKKFLKFIAQKIDKDESYCFEARNLCARFTTSVLSSTLFGTEANAFNDEICEIQHYGMRLIELAYKFLVHTMVTSFLPILRILWQIEITKWDVEKFFVDLTDQAIDYRKKSGINQTDFLEQLIHTQEKKNLVGDDLVSHAVTVFWDGYETSHIALLLTLYELARNQRVQQKLRQEILEAGDLTFDVLDNLPYLDQCIHEALRLNPALASFTRVCTETCEITDSKDRKIKIEKGTSCIVPIYSINYDETYYPEPEIFYPERFDAEYGGIKKFRDNCWLAPFGDGPRICLGLRLGRAQVKYAVSATLAQFEVTLDPKTIQPFEMLPKHLLTVPKNPIYLKFKRLNNN